MAGVGGHSVQGASRELEAEEGPEISPRGPLRCSCPFPRIPSLISILKITCFLSLFINFLATPSGS